MFFWIFFLSGKKIAISDYLFECCLYNTSEHNTSEHRAKLQRTKEGRIDHS